MLIDGEKYACEACVRGHRVSNCQHSDRPLQHINKKGRPVSQCGHCRAARKSRSAHVKCDCGEKTSKCSHLQPTLDGHRESCCCNHGGRCTCAVKNEPTLDTVPESDSEGETPSIPAVPRSKLAARRRRANTIQGDGFAFDQNGNFKGNNQKLARSSNKAGPFGLNRANSANGPEGLDGRSRTGATRRVKSEATSPSMNPTTLTSLNGLPPLDLSIIDNQSYFSNGSMDLFGSGVAAEFDAPIYSAGLSAASVDWSHYDLTDVRRDNFTPSSYSQNGTRSFNGLFDMSSSSDGLPQLANTTSTSGNVSEVEDFMPGAENDYDGFGNTFMRNAMSADLGGVDYDSVYKGADSNANNNHAVGADVSMVEDDPAFWIANYNDGMAQEDPDPLTANAMNNYWDA